MPIHIRPISDLRNKSLEISKLAHKSKSPVFITRNGRESLVVMSMATWEDLFVYPKLLEAEEDERNGDKGRPFDEVMDELAKKHGLGEWRRKKAGNPKASRRA
jgi:prevent-host-death family protein